MEVNATIPGAFHHLYPAIMVSFSVNSPLSNPAMYIHNIIHIHRPFSQGLFTSHIHILSLPQYLASIVIFTDWGKQHVTIPSPLKEHRPRCSIYQYDMYV